MLNGASFYEWFNRMVQEFGQLLTWQNICETLYSVGEIEKDVAKELENSLRTESGLYRRPALA